MNISETIQPDAVVAEIKAKDKNGVIKTLVTALVEAKIIKPPHQSSLYRAVLKREKLGSTGIGRGVAVPHARHDCVKDVVGAFGIAPQGIDFKAVDGQLVYAVFLIISPTTKDREHLEMMRAIAKLLTDSRNCRSLCEVRGKEDIVNLLSRIDNW